MHACCDDDAIATMKLLLALVGASYSDSHEYDMFWGYALREGV